MGIDFGARLDQGLWRNVSQAEVFADSNIKFLRHRCFRLVTGGATGKAGFETVQLALKKQARRSLSCPALMAFAERRSLYLPPDFWPVTTRRLPRNKILARALPGVSLSLAGAAFATRSQTRKCFAPRSVARFKPSVRLRPMRPRHLPLVFFVIS